MKVYVISDIVVTDQEKYNEYMKLAPNTIAKYGGKYLVRGGNILNSLDWNPKGRIIVLEFPSKEKLDQWQNSEEYKPVKEAEDQMEVLELEAAALLAAKNMDIDMAEAIMRVENGSSVSEMSSKELKRDLLIFAKKNPKLFLDLCNDENVVLRNFGVKATEQGILTLSSDQRHFEWANTGRKIMTVPFDEHPYSALAAWFKTDEGMEVYSNIEKRLSM